MAIKHGYKTAEEYKEGVQKKFSLLETGIIQQPSTRLLLINVSLRIQGLSENGTDAENRARLMV
jgi:hypothetical protein